MKYSFPILVLALFLAACNPVSKLVSNGNYEQAVLKGFKKLNKGKKLSTKEVQALERAFEYYKDREIQRAENASLNKNRSWSDVYGMLLDVHNKQEQLKALLPIFSKDGYKAHFSLVRIGKMEEELFTKAQSTDQGEIDRLKAEKNPANSKEIYKILQRIDKRQVYFNKKPRLVGGDGYKAQVEIMNLAETLNNAKLAAATYDFEQALEMMEKAKQGNKAAGKKAYYILDGLKNYSPLRQQVVPLLEPAKNLGIKHILVKSENASSVIMPKEFVNEMLAFQVYNLNEEWTRYYKAQDPSISFDVIATIYITAIDISPERETVNNYTDERSISEWEYEYDANGNVKKDSLGNDIKYETSVPIYADVQELIRSKAAMVEGNLIFTDARTGKRKYTKPIAAEAVFKSSTARYDGNRDALSDYTKTILRNKFLDPFPSDFELMMEAATTVKGKLKHMLKNITE